MPKLLKVLIHPHPVLRNKSQEIELNEIENQEIQKLLSDMELTVKKNDGAGLAAPQVGLNIRAIVVNNDLETLHMINPKIIKKSWAKETEDEGCLSIVNKQGELLFGPVTRHKKITCFYYNKQGKKQTLTTEGLLARIIQHEIDHLDGILFIDHLKNTEAKPYRNDEN